MDNKNIIVTAGGTGGHTFPAEATATALINKGYSVTLVTDRRYLKYRKPPKGIDLKIIDSATPSGDIFKKIKATFAISKGLLQSLSLIKKIKPAGVIGFGGYPSFPMITAAVQKNIPLIIQEQNSFLGKVNKFGAKNAKVIATAYDSVEGIPDGIKSIKTGNPIRKEFTSLREKREYSLPNKEEKLNMLITGGSQGASIFSKIIPAAIINLQEKYPNIHIIQQCREEDCEYVRSQYDKYNISSEVSNFIENMPEAMNKAHIIIARSGASTISEITMLGIPAIFVPLPYAADDHQTKNAQALVEKNAAIILKQSDFTSETIYTTIQSLLKNHESLLNMAENSFNLGIPEATENLVKLVKEVMNNN